MRKLQAEDQCCAYRAKLATKKDTQSRQKPKSATGCCAGKRLTCDEISKMTTDPSTPATSKGKVKKKIKRCKKSIGCSLDTDRLFSKIQPSINEREKYLNAIHIICVLEAEELIRIKEIQKIREQLKESQDLDGSERQTNDNGQKIEQISSSTKSSGIEVNSEENHEINSLEGKISEKTVENGNHGKTTNTAAKKSTLQNKNERASICSFDSRVDLTGLHLTKEDVKKIEEDRKKMRQQQNSEDSASARYEAD